MAAQMLEAALLHHRANRLDDAERIYRQILSGRPSHSDALHFLGVIHGQKGQPQQAVFYLKRIVQMFPNTKYAESAEAKLSVLEAIPTRSESNKP